MIGLNKIGEVRGHAVVKDKYGNVKGEFDFGGPATLEQAEAVAEATGKPLQINQVSQENAHASDTDHSRS